MARAQAQGIPTPVAQQRTGATPSSNPQSNGVSSPHAQPSNPSSSMPMQARSHPGQQPMQGGMPNGNVPNLPMGMQNIPRSQMQMNMNGQQPMTPQARMLHQQALMNRQQFLQNQQQQLSQPGNLAAAHLAGTNLAMQNPHLMAQMNAQKMNGVGNQPLNGLPGSSTSPPMGQVTPAHTPQARPLSSGHIPAIAQYQARISQQHPDWTPEQVNEMAKRELHQRIAQQQQRQNALNAAAGNMYQQNGTVMGNSSPPNQQLYPQQFRSNMIRRPSQQGGQAGSPNAARPPSRSATPQNAQQQQQQQQQTQQQQAQHQQAQPPQQQATPTQQQPQHSQSPSMGQTPQAVRN